MVDIFGKKLGDYIKKGLLGSESVEEFDGCYQELKRKWIAYDSKGEKLISYLENGKTIMTKDDMRGELRSISGLGFQPKPQTQNPNESANNMVKRNLKKLSQISDVVRELKRRVEEQEVLIQLSLINQGGWKVQPGYKEHQITEDKFYQMNKEQRLKFITRFNNTVKAPEYDGSIGNKNYISTVTNKMTITTELSEIMYPPLAVLEQIFSKAEKYVYYSTDSIKTSPGDTETPSSFIVASASNPSSPHTVMYQKNGKYDCDGQCLRFKSCKICSHTVAVAECNEELHKFVEYF